MTVACLSVLHVATPSPVWYAQAHSPRSSRWERTLTMGSGREPVGGVHIYDAREVRG